MSVTLHDAPVREIHPITLYRILALRVDVFVVEQDCAYPDLDGRDVEPDARLVWATRDDGDGDDDGDDSNSNSNSEVLATLRLLTDRDGRARIGRVATAATARSEGLAAQLMCRALELSGDREVMLEAQSQLEEWYARFGFIRAGANYVEDGIAHTPMRRPAGAS